MQKEDCENIRRARKWKKKKDCERKEKARVGKDG